MTSGYSLEKDFFEIDGFMDIQQEKVVRQKIDIFSLGICIYEMISPVKLYNKKQSQEFEKGTSGFFEKKYLRILKKN